MTSAELHAKLTGLLALPNETEWVEHKLNNAEPREIGEYLSALSNSAALHRQPYGYILWGVEDGTHAVKGTTFKPHRQKGAGNEDLEPWLARLLSPRIDFKIYELNKAKVCIDGKMTRTALILLGKPESTHHLSPSHPQLTWILKDRDGMERDYKHFDPPFLLAVDALLANVRNLTCRVLPWGTLFPVELLQYDDWVLREVLHNAIAHSDYPASGRINVVEFEDRMVVANMGSFLPGDVEDVIRRDAPFSVERNPFLAQAMVGLQMIDTIGSGIKRIYQVQKKRSFPMPDYDLSRVREVQVGIIGKVLDEKYTRMLMARTDLDLWDVIALDKVQKGRQISYEQFRSLKAKKLVEGRRPNLFVSAEIAAATETKAEYIKKRGFDKDHYKKMVVAYLKKFGDANRADIDQLLMDKLSDSLDEDQKRNFIHNLIQEMRKSGILDRDGSNRWSKWRLDKSASNTED
jgi:ATP-dependent DNA helicase RecG